MKVYYLDESLDKEELEFVKSSLVQREGLLSIQEIEQIRIPTILPTPQENGSFSETIEEQTQLLEKNLLKVGINESYGTQVVWVMPKETHWGVKFQLAISNLTGCFPYVFQRWSVNEAGKTVRKNMRLIDGHGMMGGKG